MIIQIPYRINWAGAYLDCINKPVITSVIDKYITVISQKRDDDLISIFSKEENKVYNTSLLPDQTHFDTWEGYVDGCVAVFARNDIKLTTGCEMVVSNDLPSGIGLSSSAAFIIAILKTLVYHNNLRISDSDIVEFGYWVEHEYLRIPCGRMDFKAVIHEKGIWKINTSSSDLSLDKKILDIQSEGLLIYSDTHNHINDKKFINNVIDIQDTYMQYKRNKTALYINTEDSIVNVITFLKDKINLNYLGQFLNQSNFNLKSWLDLDIEIFNIKGIYGQKAVGSGLKGAQFLLIDNNLKDFIVKELEKICKKHIAICNI